MTPEEKAREIVRSTAIFTTGCSNTMQIGDFQPATGPEQCDDCRDYFLQRIADILAGKIEVKTCAKKTYR